MIASLLQQAPAETTNYMIAGYSVIFSIMLLYIVSIFIRGRNLRRDQETLSKLDDADK